MSRIAVGETLKVLVFKRSVLFSHGHSLLVKKEKDDKYVFFDPNTGEERNLSFDELVKRLDKQLAFNGADDILFLKGSSFLKKIEPGK